MKPLTCEMCGSTNLIKQDGVFVCQSCGTKYSLEEAKKMMVEGTVDVTGTVKIDTSSELANLYELARRAREDNNSENAQKFYDQILIKDPKSWEANFFSVYYKAMSCKIIEISSAGSSVTNCITSTLKLISENVLGTDLQEKSVQEIQIYSSIIATMLCDASKSHYMGIDWEIRSQYRDEYIERCFNGFGILISFGEVCETIFPNKFELLRAQSYKDACELYVEMAKCLGGDYNTILNNLFGKHFDLIKKYFPDWEKPVYNAPINSNTNTNNSGGCYVATAVYGSYDCPQVWTLRRFRDYTLAETWYGRAFVKIYYAVSPTLVKWFGTTNWFRNLWRKPLDRMVSKLNQQGVDNSPYCDRIW